MSSAPNGESTYRLSASMVEALEQLIVCRPAPHFIPNVKTAVAMLNRGWIEKVAFCDPIHTRSLYTITRAGAIALKIGQRE